MVNAFCNTQITLKDKKTNQKLPGIIFNHSTRSREAVRGRPFLTLNNMCLKKTSYYKAVFNHPPIIGGFHIQEQKNLIGKEELRNLPEWNCNIRWIEWREKLEQIVLQLVSDAWLSTWFANVFGMKDERWSISPAAAAASLTAPERAAPWPGRQGGPATGRSAAHTGSRTTSAPRRSSARPADKSGTGRPCHRWTRFIMSKKKNRKEAKLEKREREGE